jgi:tetratricopeptide (TPR) repeat protein
MNGMLIGGGRRFFPSFFYFLYILTLVSGVCLSPPQTAAQKSEGEGLSRFDRLAEEATLLNKRGKYDEVISLLEPHKADQKNDSTLFFNELGIAYRNKGRLNEAIKAYQQAYARESQNPEVSPVILNNLGYTYSLKKDYPKAIEQFEKAITLAPRFKEAHSNLSLIYYELQKYEDALKEIEVVLKLDPNHEAAKKFRDRIRKKMQGKE